MANIVSQLVVNLIDGVSAPARTVANSLKGITRTVKEANSGKLAFSDRLDAAMARNTRAMTNARGSMVDAIAGYYTLKAAIAGPVEEATRFESAMADVKKVVDFATPQAFKDFQTGLMKLSRDIPQTVNGLAEIAAAAGQAGIAGQDLVRFTEAAAKIGVAFDISASEAGDSMAKMMTGLGLSVDQVVLLSDAMNQLSNAQASSAAEVLDVVRRVGAQAKMFGFTAEQTAAFGSAMIAAGADSDVAATSFRNMGLALTKGGAATKSQYNAMLALGLDPFKVAADMQKDAVGTTLDVLERLSKLPKEVQAATASDLFGNEARALGPLLTNLDLVRNSIALVGDQSKYAGSAFKEFEARNNTFGSALQRFDNLLTNLKITIGNALLPALSELLQKLSPLVEMVTTLAGKYPRLTASIIGATGALIGFRIAVAGLKFAGLLGQGGALQLLSMTMGKLSKLSTNASELNALKTSLAGMDGLKLTSLDKFGSFASALARMTGLSTIAEGLGLIGAALSTPGMVAAGITIGGIAAAFGLLWKYWDRISSFTGGFFGELASEISDLLAPAFQKLQPYLQPIADLFGVLTAKASEFGSWLGSFFQREVLTDAQKAQYAESGASMAHALVEGVKNVVNGLVEWFSSLPSRIIAAVGSIDLSGLFKWPSLPSYLGGKGPVAAAPNRADVITGARAKGGPISRGSTYLVGEKGPELITAGRSGYVNRNGAGGGAVQVAPVFNMTFNGKTDAEDVVEKIRRVMRDEVRETFRGVLSDTGMRFA